MKQGYTHISVVLDRSGSMESIRADAEGGLNAFIKDQKALDGEATFTLVQFDSVIEKVYDFVDINRVMYFRLDPRGSTALLDAIGTEIDNLGTKLASLKEEDRPEKVLFVIITDGWENSSYRYCKDDIKQRIQHQEQVYSWEFVFLAANQDAITTGMSFGINSDKSMTFAANDIGSTLAFSKLSANTCSYRSGEDSTYNWKQEDRDEQASAGA